MRESRRMKRLAKSQVQTVALSLTSLMDIFTILLLYLLVNQSDGMVLDPPKEIILPESIAQTTPRETLVVMVSDQDVVVQGEPIVTMQEVRTNDGEIIEAIRSRMIQIRESAIGLESQSEGQNEEVTVLVDRDIEFRDVKRVMASCTAAGYTKISLAVNQK